jgi:hypothetical protein
VILFIYPPFVKKMSANISYEERTGGAMKCPSFMHKKRRTAENPS